ncbi:recombinase-like helix-turn-helix domain-containing protein [Hydrogenophaga sp. 2FB]|uniref:recombinase-like helix-turn-helix domain-containing protein n=1 Tax=Hydrogenophaga sp. 2FB TaxID=2502187 RepID=UPI0010F46462|nr:recombinase-like helix-turn-helix domain-containing protein [Hydrogenophaga sp. 2FB]
MSVTAISFNPHLLSAKNAKRSKDAGNGLIFQPGDEENLRWQTRFVEPTEYEQALTSAIVQIYAEDGRTPEAFAEGLNARNLLQANGEAWTPAVLSTELERLAA